MTENPARSNGISKGTINPAWKFLLPIFAVWLLLYGSYALTAPPLPDGPGTMHAEIGREMLTRNDWTATFVNGLPLHSSARALDRSIAASFRLFGVADWSARLPIALAVLALAVVMFFIGRQLFVWNAAGLYAALFLLALPVTFLATRDLSENSFFTLIASLYAWILWQLLVAKRSSGWNAAGISATACLLALLITDWPEALLPLAILALCWAVRLIDEPEEQARWLLIGWIGCACLLAGVVGLHRHSVGLALTAVPPFALLFAGWLANDEVFSDRKTARTGYIVFAAGIFLAAVALYLAFSHRFDLAFHYHSNSFALNRISWIVAALALVVGAGGYLIYRLRHQLRIANCFLVGALAGLTAAVQVEIVMSSPWYSSQILADAIRPELNPTDIVVVDGKYPDASSFAFYMERPVVLALPPGANAPAFIANLPHGLVAVDQAWKGETRVYLWTSADHPRALPGPSFVIAASGGKEILSNQANSGGAAF